MNSTDKYTSNDVDPDQYCDELNPKLGSHEASHAMSLWPLHGMCALIVITCLSVLCPPHWSSVISSSTPQQCCSTKAHYSARNARSSKLCPITISIRTFHPTRAAYSRQDKRPPERLGLGVTKGLGHLILDWHTQAWQQTISFRVEASPSDLLSSLNPLIVGITAVT